MFNEIRALDQQIAQLQARRDELFRAKRKEAVEVARSLVEAVDFHSEVTHYPQGGLQSIYEFVMPSQ